MQMHHAAIAHIGTLSISVFHSYDLEHMVSCSGKLRGKVPRGKHSPHQSGLRNCLVYNSPWQHSFGISRAAPPHTNC